jgi:hypothetical protein
MPSSTAVPSKPRRGFRRWRKMTWVLIVWCAIILVWAIAGGASADHSAANNCIQQSAGVLSPQDCQNAADAGTGIGVAIVLLIGFVGFAFFSMIWFMTRPRTRECPVCGNDVRKGITVCGKCDHDFARAAGAPALATQ